MIADDLGKQLGCYGATKIRTQHIDKLASEGTRFDGAFASTASCSGSRSVIYSGLHTHQNGQYGLAHDRHHFMTFDHVETAPALLADHGYLTGIIGKVHVGPPAVYPWEVREENGSRDGAMMADRASVFFEHARHDKKPFFLTIGFIDPHRDSSRSGFGNYERYDERIQAADYKASDVDVPTFLNDSSGARLEFAEYYNSISRLDQGVGMVLSRLTEAGLLSNTLIIFLSDNGPPFVNSKTTLYEAGVNLPLIVKSPEALPGIVSTNMVSYVDILPTILDWTKHPKTNDNRRLGRSLLPILSEPSPIPGWDCVFGSHTFHEVTNYWPTRFMRNRRYKYHRNIAWRLDFPFTADLYGSLTWEDIRNASTQPLMIGSRPLKKYFFRPPEELYDMDADSNEVHNLAGDPKHEEILKEMRRALEEWQRRTEDPWLYRDGVSVLSIQHHLDAGLKVPDRWDFDVDNPTNLR